MPKKSWNSVWEKAHSKQNWGKYPPEELVRFVARNFYPFSNKSKIRFLDMGCGTGSCSWYIAREGFSVYGIDGSKTAIKNAKLRFKKEHLNGNFQVMDMINLDFPNDFFDAVIDISAIQHNSIKNIPIIFNEINRVLKNNGAFFSIMVGNGTHHSTYLDKGFVHYYKLNEIKKIFKQFKIVGLEKSDRTDNNMTDVVKHWIVHAKKS